jgi:PKD repeat protein
LETNGIDRLNVGVSPPTATPLAVRFASPPVSSIGISPDGGTLYVGEDDDSSGGVQSFSVADPANTTFWDGRNIVQSNGLRLDGVQDLVVAPDGSALYLSGPGFNSAGASESQVLALALRPFTATEQPTWSEGLQPGTAGGIDLGSPNSLAVSPDGQTVFAGGTVGPGSDSSVQAFAASSGAPGANGSVPIVETANDAGGVVSIALSPDGQHALAYGRNGTGLDMIVAMNASNLHVVGTSINANSKGATPSAPQSIAITPAQLSLSTSFSVNLAQAGQPTGFSANPPSTGVPGISYSYTWNFGDGSPAASGQTVNHTFATPNTYSVNLTVRGQSPSGSNVDTPGQTPFWRALAATSTQNVTIPLTPPPTTTPHHGSTTTTKPGQKKLNPKLTVNPTVGPPGTIVTITGKGFAANKQITISWSVSSGSIVVTTDSHGKLGPTQLPILIPDVLGPRFAVASSTPAAKAAFLVVPGTAEPGGSQGIYLFRSDGP